MEEQVSLAAMIYEGNRCWWHVGLSSVVAFGKYYHAAATASLMERRKKQLGRTMRDVNKEDKGKEWAGCFVIYCK